MKKLLFITFLLCLTAEGQNFFSKNQDKLAHFGVGFTASTLTYCAVYNVTGKPKRAFWCSIGTSVLLGAGKELYDRKKYNAPLSESVKDFSATVIGGALAGFTLKFTF